MKEYLKRAGEYSRLFFLKINAFRKIEINISIIACFIDKNNGLFIKNGSASVQTVYGFIDCFAFARSFGIVWC